LQLERFEQTSKQLPKDLWTSLQRSVKFNRDFACVSRSLDENVRRKYPTSRRPLTEQWSAAKFLAPWLDWLNWRTELPLQD
jgi:hypothetical protein